MPFVPRLTTDAPSFTPSPSGLLTVAQSVPTTAHWMNGVTWSQMCVSGMGSITWDECITVTGTGTPVPPPPSKTDNVDYSFRGATPFAVYVEFDCSAAVGTGNAEAVRIANDALARAGSWQVERAFWTGSSPSVTGVTGSQSIVFPHLAATANFIDVTSTSPALLQSVPVTGGPFDVADGLGFLEQYLADCYGGVGIIHVPARLLPTLVAWGLITRQGAALSTYAGNRVAVGAGYPGTTPSGGAPGAGNIWMFATGNVFAYSSPVRILDSPDPVDRAENTRKMIAERTHVLGWDCCHAGVEVSLGVPVT